jgi:hypothetical protein
MSAKAIIFERVLRASSADGDIGTFDSIVDQWFVESNMALDISCICTTSIKEVYIIRNIHNGNTLEIGSTCVKRFLGDYSTAIVNDVIAFNKHAAESLIYSEDRCGTCLRIRCACDRNPSVVCDVLGCHMIFNTDDKDDHWIDDHWDEYVKKNSIKCEHCELVMRTRSYTGHLRDKHMLFVLPYGKFKGKRIEDIMYTRAGANYLKWGKTQTANSEMMRQMHTAFDRLQ